MTWPASDELVVFGAIFLVLVLIDRLKMLLTTLRAGIRMEVRYDIFEYAIGARIRRFREGSLCDL